MTESSARAEDRYNLAIACNILSACHRDLGELNEARRRVEQGLAQQKQALEVDGKNPVDRNALSNLQEQLGEVLLGQADHAAAARVAAEHLEIWPGDQKVNAWASRTLAACASLAGKDPGASPSTARAYADRAMVALRRAVTNSAVEAHEWRKIPEFKLLLDRPDFQLLMMDLEFPANPFAR